MNNELKLKEINIGIVGSRNFENQELFDFVMKMLQTSYKFNMIVTGCAKGADKMAREFANENQIKLVVHKADWNQFGLKAGMMRNSDIVNDSNSIIAFWDGTSKVQQTP